MRADVFSKISPELFGSHSVNPDGLLRHLILDRVYVYHTLRVCGYVCEILTLNSVPFSFVFVTFGFL